MRVYNRALNAAEIQADMTARHARRTDTTPPSAPAALTAPARSELGRSLSWTASTDNVGLVRYNVHRGTTPGFTPGAANRSRSRPATSYTDTGLAAGTYYYRVTAEDAAGNVGAGLQRGDGVGPADTTPPTARG